MAIVADKMDPDKRRQCILSVDKSTFKLNCETVPRLTPYLESAEWVEASEGLHLLIPR